MPLAYFLLVLELLSHEAVCQRKFAEQRIHADGRPQRVFAAEAAMSLHTACEAPPELLPYGVADDRRVTALQHAATGVTPVLRAV